MVVAAMAGAKNIRPRDILPWMGGTAPQTPVDWEAKRRSIEAQMRMFGPPGLFVEKEPDSG